MVVYYHGLEIPFEILDERVYFKHRGESGFCSDGIRMWLKEHGFLDNKTYRQVLREGLTVRELVATASAGPVPFIRNLMKERGLI